MLAADTKGCFVHLDGTGVVRTYGEGWKRLKTHKIVAMLSLNNPKMLVSNNLLHETGKKKLKNVINFISAS